MLKCPNCGSMDKFEKLDKTIYESSIRDMNSDIIEHKKEEDYDVDKIKCLKCNYISKLHNFYTEDGLFICPKRKKSEGVIGIAENATIHVQFDKFGRIKDKGWWYANPIEIIEANYTKCQCWECDYVGNIEEFKVNKNVSLPLKEDN